MIKPAKTKYDIHPLIKKRFTPRGYADKSVSMEEVYRMLEAASWAPSSYNEQPWRFILGFKGQGEGHSKILSCLFDKNTMWAQTAPVLMISFAKNTLTVNGKPNRFSAFDAGQAMAMMSLQAAEDDIYISQMGGFDAQMARDVFEIPEDYEVLAAAAIGKIDHSEEDLDRLPESDIIYRSRKALMHFAYVDEWGKSLG